MPLHHLPAISSCSMEETILTLLSMGFDIDDIDLVTRPSPGSIAAGRVLLKHLGAIDSKTGEITELGIKLSSIPAPPQVRTPTCCIFIVIFQ